MSRRLASGKYSNGEKSQAEPGPNAYAMSSGENNQPTYETIQLEDSAPAETTKPEGNNLTLVDNDLYE